MRAVWLSAGAALLLGGAAVALRAGRPTPEPGPPKAAAPAGMAPVAPPPQAAADPLANLAFRAVLSFSESIKRVPKDELARSLERDGLRQLDELIAELRRDPSRWTAVLDLLSCIDDAKAMLPVTEKLKTAVDENVEPFLVERLRPSNPLGARRVSLHLIADRDTPQGFAALSGAAQEEPDMSLRCNSLQALVARKSRDPQAPSAAQIDDLFRRVAATDPDPGVRTLARRFSGDTATPSEVPQEPEPSASRPRPTGAIPNFPKPVPRPVEPAKGPEAPK